jgi:hypothetical protein
VRFVVKATLTRGGSGQLTQSPPSACGHWLSSARMHVIETQTSAKTAGITRSSTEAPLKGRDGSQRDAAFGQPSNLPADRRNARKFRRNSCCWDRWSEWFQARQRRHLSGQKSAKISLQAVGDRYLPVCDRLSPRTGASWALLFARVLFLALSLEQPFAPRRALQGVTVLSGYDVLGRTQRGSAVLSVYYTSFLCTIIASKRCQPDIL